MRPAGDSAIAPILAGDRRAIARAISLIENQAPASTALCTHLAAHVGRAQVVGITGPPGAGKSTLIDALLGEWLSAGMRVAVVAVDPSSPKSGGAVLGDRVRMGRHAAAESVFIRSIAARGHLGGVSRATDRIIDVLDAAGFGLVVVETVGAGQSEVEISGLVDTAIVVYPPGLGDDVQAIKAGILEIADILVVNKGDSALAERTVRELNDMLAMRRPGAAPVPVLRTTAITGEGVGALAEQIATRSRGQRAGRRLAGRAPPTADEIAAVDRAISGWDAGHRFAAVPLSRAAVEEILAVAYGARGPSAVPRCHVHVLAGDRKVAVARAVADGLAPGDVFLGAPVGLVFTGDGGTGVGDGLECGMLLQSVAVAARARGLVACADASIAERRDLVARALVLASGEVTICGMGLGYPEAPNPGDAGPAGPAGRSQANAFARFEGFDT